MMRGLPALGDVITISPSLVEVGAGTESACDGIGAPGSMLTGPVGIEGRRTGAREEEGTPVFLGATELAGGADWTEGGVEVGPGTGSAIERTEEDSVSIIGIK